MIKLNQKEIEILCEALDAIFNQEAGEEDEYNKMIMELEVKLNDYYDSINSTNLE